MKETKKQGARSRAVARWLSLWRRVQQHLPALVKHQHRNPSLEWVA